MKTMAPPLQKQVTQCNLSINPKTTSHPQCGSSSCVPFKWEETPGKPLSDEIVDKNTMPPSPSPLQLPPKLQFQAQHYTNIKKTTKSMTFKNQNLTIMCKTMFRSFNNTRLQGSDTSGHGGMTKNDSTILELDEDDAILESTTAKTTTTVGSSNSSGGIDDSHEFLSISNQKGFKHVESAWQPQNPLYEDKLAEPETNHMSMDDEERSSSSSLWQPMLFEASSPAWPFSAEISEKATHQKPYPREQEQDENEVRMIHKTVPSPKPFDSISASTYFGPNEDHKIKEGLIRIRAMLTKVFKLQKIKKKKEASPSDMWSPTLATYLYNQQKIQQLHSELDDKNSCKGVSLGNLIYSSSQEDPHHQMSNQQKHEKHSKKSHGSYSDSEKSSGESGIRSVRNRLKGMANNKLVTRLKANMRSSV